MSTRVSTSLPWLALPPRADANGWSMGNADSSQPYLGNHRNRTIADCWWLLHWRRDLEENGKCSKDQRASALPLHHSANTRTFSNTFTSVVRRQKSRDLFNLICSCREARSTFNVSFWSVLLQWNWARQCGHGIEDRRLTRFLRTMYCMYHPMISCVLAISL